MKTAAEVIVDAINRHQTVVRIVIELDDSLTVGAYIDGVTKPTQRQAQTLIHLAEVVDRHRDALTEESA